LRDVKEVGAMGDRGGENWRKMAGENSFEQLQNDLEKLESVVSFVVSFDAKTTETIDK
jgi:hypothetical protein